MADLRGMASIRLPLKTSRHNKFFFILFPFHPGVHMDKHSAMIVILALALLFAIIVAFS